jgi:hypothetical protein
MAVALLALALALAASGWPSAAQARVVGIMFDDSGSMMPRSHLPSFAIQLLISSLDGRDDRDRVFTTQLSQFLYAVSVGGDLISLPFHSDQVDSDGIDRLLSSPTLAGPPYSPRAIGTRDLQQALIDTIGEKWPVIRPGTGTPYIPIEVMLRVLARETKPEEPAFLVIVTDGDFDNDKEMPLPSPEHLRDSYEKYRSQFKGPLHVFFLLIASEDEAAVEQQKVRANLLEVFNGKAQDGAYTVGDVGSLIAAVKAIVGRISATDLDRFQSYLSVQGNDLVVDSPLSLSRITIMSTGSDQTPLAKLMKTSFGEVERLEFDARMNDVDRQWPAIGRQRARTVHLRQSPALPPGKYTLSFDRPPGTGVTVLFEANVTLKVEILDGETNLPVPPTNNRVTLVLRHDYKAHLTLVDRDSGNTIATPPLSKAVYQAFLSRPADTRSLTVVADPNRPGVAYADLRPEQVGAYDLATSMRLPGFLTTTGQPAALDVVNSLVSLDTRIDPEQPCPAALSCGSQGIPVPYDGSSDTRRVAKAVITFRGALPGGFTVQLEGGPPGFELRYAGQPLNSDTPVMASPGESRTIELVRTPAWRPATGNAGQGGFPLTLIATARAPLTGSSRVERRGIPLVPTATLAVTGNDQDPTGVSPPRLDAAALENGTTGWRLEARDTLKPPTVNDLHVRIPSLLLSAAVEVDKGRIRVIPRSAAWCACLLWIDGGMHDVIVTYTSDDGLQTASQRTKVDIAPGKREILQGCGLLALALLLLVWLIGALAAAARRRRFPPGSFLKVDEGGAVPRYRELKGNPWSWLTCLVWFAIRVPHERCQEGGLTLEASSHGANIICDRQWPNYFLDRMGQTLAEIHPEPRPNSVIALFWGDKLQEAVAKGSKITLKDQINDDD